MVPLSGVSRARTGSMWTYWLSPRTRQIHLIIGPIDHDPVLTLPISLPTAARQPGSESGGRGL